MRDTYAQCFFLCMSEKEGGRVGGVLVGGVGAGGRSNSHTFTVFVMPVVKNIFRKRVVGGGKGGEG